MATNNPSMAYLMLDQGYDPIFDPTLQLTGREAVAQAILTRLKLLFGEWWEDLSLGLPAFQSILGQLETTQNLHTMELLVQQQIYGVPGVNEIISVAAKFQNDAFVMDCTVNTVFGPITISNVPGLSASLNT